MNEQAIGKLVIRAHITQTIDDHGRARGRWATLMTQYGMTHEEAKQAAFQFKENNPHISAKLGGVYAEWIPNPEHIYL